MIKKLVLPAILTSFILLYAFWNPIAGVLIEKCIDSYCWHAFGDRMEVKRIKKHAGAWVIDQPKISHRGTHLGAESVTIAFGLHPLKREIDLSVSVEGSRIALEGDLANLDEVLLQSVQSTFPVWLLKINSSLAIRQGEVVWHNGPAEGKGVETARFDLAVLADAHQRKVNLDILMTPSLPETNHLALEVIQGEEGAIHAQVQCEELDCQKLVKIFKSLGHSLHGWEVEKGVVDGSVQCVIPHKGRPYAWGTASLKSLSLAHPDLNVAGEIGALKLDLQTEHPKHGVPHIVGSIELGQGSNVALLKRGRRYWEIDAVDGGVYFLSQKGIELKLNGMCTHNNRSFELVAEGDVAIFDETQAALELACRLIHPNSATSEFSFSARQLGNQCNFAEIELKNLGRDEFSFLKAACEKYNPEWADVHMLEGRIDATGLAYLNEYRVTELKLDKIRAQNLKYHLDTWDLSLEVAESEGNFALNLSNEDVLSSLHADFSVKKGGLLFQGFNEEAWHFQDIKTEISIRDGVLQRSELIGLFAGMAGKIAVDWQSQHEAVKVQFSGEAEKMCALLPKQIQPGVRRSFAGDLLELSASLDLKPSRAGIDGRMHVFSPRSREKETIVFGFDVERCSEKIWKNWPEDEFARIFWNCVGQEALQSIIPAVASPAILFKSNWVAAESGVAGLVVRRGWFHAENLPLSRYVAPFIFPKQEMFLEGTGTFKGLFDHSQLVVEYEGEQVVLYNDNLVVKADKIEALKEANHHKKIYAAHYFDFAKGTHYGSIPLQGATYIEKNTGLVFADTKAHVTLEGEKIHLSNIQTHLAGIALGGAIDIDFDLPDDNIFDLVVRTDSITGNVSGLIDLYNCLNGASPPLDLPLEGELAFDGKGGYMRFHFMPHDYELDLKVQGRVENGRLPIVSSGLEIKNIGLQFSYDHADKQLAVSHIHGLLQIPAENQRQEEYVIAGEYFRLLDLESRQSEFDMWIGDASRDIVRLVGKTFPIQKDPAHRLLAFSLDRELSHFGEVHPSIFELAVNEAAEVEAFRLCLDLRLNHFLHDLKRLSRSGILNSSKKLKKRIEEVRAAHGVASLDVKYDREGDALHFEVQGEKIAFDDYKIDHCRLIGNKSSDLWHIEKLNLDQLSLSGLFRPADKNWNIDYLNLTYGTALKFRMDGTYNSKESAILGHLTFLEMDLSQGGAALGFEDLTQDCSPSGTLSAAGTMKLELGGEGSGWRADAILDASLKNWEMRGLRFQDAYNFSLHFVSDRGFTIRRLETALLDRQTLANRTNLQIEKVNYEFHNGELKYEDLHFQTPSHYLPWFADSLSESFPEIFTPGINEVLRNAKLRGALEGLLQFELNPPYMGFHLALNDGKYHFLNAEHDLSHLEIEFDPFEFKVSSKYEVEGQSVWLTGRSTSPVLSHGELLLTHYPVADRAKVAEEDSLWLYWDNSPEKGLSIREASGYFYGLSLQLKKDPLQPLSSEAIYLEGDVAVDSQAAKVLFPRDIAAKIDQWRIGDGYHLKGKWRWLKGSSDDYSKKLQFSGKLLGEKFVCKGYQFDEMQADLDYNPRSLRLSNLLVKDAAGILHAEKIDFVRNGDDHWYFSLPVMRVNKFRPSLLQTAGSPRPVESSSLIIRDIILEGCQGSLANSNAMIGQGTLHFSNRSKKLLKNTIFQIPVEILSRIGLDSAVLTPVAGTVFYRVQDGRIYLTRFKDIYSEGKLSKFYLSGAAPSSLDFEGNLNLHVRMKQYNLLFKLAEPFTVTINGDLTKPTYTLQKEKREPTASR